MTTATESVRPALQEQPFLAAFQPRHVERLEKLARRVSFGPDHVIFREGDECSELYLVVDGRVALEITAPGQTLRVDTLSSGDEFGWSSILMGGGKYFQARTLEPVEALAFEGADVRAMCEEDPAFGYALMRRLLGVVAERLQATRLQVIDMYWTPAKRAGA